MATLGAWRAFPFALSLAFLAGCSALSLDEFEPCVSDADCNAALREDHGFPASCARYYCAPSGYCDEIDGERCDGLDNDCDGVIDKALPLAVDPLMRVPTRGAPSSLTRAGDSIYATSSGVAERMSHRGLKEELHYATAQEGELALDLCERRAGMLADCWFSQLHTSAAPEGASSALAISVDTLGAAEGRVRVGEIVRSVATRTNLFYSAGQAALSSSHRGLGLSARRSTAASAERLALCNAAAGGEDEALELHCEGSEEALRRIDVDCGVADLDFAIAQGADTGASQVALASMVSGSFSRASCRIEDAPSTERDESLRTLSLSAIYLYDFEGQHQVTASGEGVPTVLGQTRSPAAPALVSYGDSFVVAYADEHEAIQAAIVRDLPARAAIPESESWTDTIECAEETPLVELSSLLCGSDVGECRVGAMACAEDDSPVCVGWVAPRDEVCGDSRDNDCDGLIDESSDCLPAEETCASEDATCDAVDDDCDGAIDEDYLGRACTSEDGADDGCDGALMACVGGREICRGGRRYTCGGATSILDADCDGVVDDPANTCTPQQSSICAGNGIDENGTGSVAFEGAISARQWSAAYARDNAPERAPRRSDEAVRMCTPQPGIEASIGERVELVPARSRVDGLIATVADLGDRALLGIAWRERGEVFFQVSEVTLTCVCQGSDAPCGSTGCEEVRSVSTLGARSEPLLISSAFEGEPSEDALIGEIALGYLPVGFRQDESAESGGFYVVYESLGEARPTLQVQRVVVDSVEGALAVSKLGQLQKIPNSVARGANALRFHAITIRADNKPSPVITVADRNLFVGMNLLECAR